ncbi:virulence RhuM family protein [bacterium]|nr:virulence RhuM family protein [bacterium]
MNTAKIVVGKFGGQSALAGLIGKGQSTVGYWVKTGTIPAKWHAKLLTLAAEEGISLSSDDFIQKAHVPASFSDVEQTEDALSIPIELQQTNFLFYSSPDGSIKVQVAVGDETVWASQKGMAELFDVESNTITYHLKNIFNSNELIESAVTRKIRVTAADNKPYLINFYSLDAIISVGYRVNSYKATQFRKWATTVLREYLIKGYALNDERLKQGNQLFGKDYFDDLLERIREIRASERKFYQKITDIYSQCSIDYDKNSPLTQQFYAHVQDKLHYAIHGHTSAELIELRADSSKPNMGLYSWKNEGKKGKITKRDVTVGKNYLNHEELDNMNRLVSMYLDTAENFARRHKAMTMKDWLLRLDNFLEFNAYDVLENYGSVKRDDAERHALSEYEIFRVKQDIEFKSDFDEVVDKIKVRKRLPKANNHENGV